MAKSVSEEPEVTVTHWGIMQDRHGYRLVGLYHVPGLGRSGRVSSPITEFDEHAMVATTSSGRRYHLSGPSDDRVAAGLIRAHIRKWQLGVDDVALADLRQVSLALAPKPSGMH